MKIQSPNLNVQMKSLFLNNFNCDLSLAQQILSITNTRATHLPFKFYISKHARLKDYSEYRQNNLKIKL